MLVKAVAVAEKVVVGAGLPPLEPLKAITAPPFLAASPLVKEPPVMVTVPPSDTQMAPPCPSPELLVFTVPDDDKYRTLL